MPRMKVGALSKMPSFHNTPVRPCGICQRSSQGKWLASAALRQRLGQWSAPQLGRSWERAAEHPPRQIPSAKALSSARLEGPTFKYPWDANMMENNVNPWLRNPKLFIWGRYHFSSQVLFTIVWVTSTMNKPGFTNQGLTVHEDIPHSRH